MTTEDVCREIHRLLELLPLYTAPVQVPFSNGLYFFYEAGETSDHGLTGRIVRVGNHPRSTTGLVTRLRQHYSGRKNGSVFRKFLGGALLRASNWDHPCLAPGPGKGHWEHQGATACLRCLPVEQEVSALLRSRFRFRCVAVKDQAERNDLEARLIATLAACSICKPSPHWLGLNAYADTVRRTGLWNSQHTDGLPMVQADLSRFSELVKARAPKGLA